MRAIMAAVAAVFVLAGAPVLADPERRLDGFGPVQFGMTRAEVLARLDGRVLNDGDGLRAQQPLALAGPLFAVYYDFDGADRLGRVRLQHAGNAGFVNCLGQFQRLLQVLTVRHGQAAYVLTDTEAGLHAWRAIFIFANGAGAHLSTDYQGPDSCETGIYFLAPDFQQPVRG